MSNKDLISKYFSTEGAKSYYWHTAETNSKIDLIYSLYSDGFSMRDIANILGISHITVYRKLREA